MSSYVHVKFDPGIFDAWSGKDIAEFPSFHEAEYDCPKCRNKIRHPVYEEFHNYEYDLRIMQEVIRDYRKNEERILSDLEAMYGADNPATVYLKNETDAFWERMKNLKRRYGLDE